jgi:hypothetical protein
MRNNPNRQVICLNCGKTMREKEAFVGVSDQYFCDYVCEGQWNEKYKQDIMTDEEKDQYLRSEGN